MQLERPASENVDLRQADLALKGVTELVKKNERQVAINDDEEEEDDEEDDDADEDENETQN